MSTRTDRLQAAASALKQAGLDALLLGPGADMLYVSGFEHSHAGERLLALVVRQDGTAAWISPTMNVPQIRERALPGQEIRAWTDAETYLPALRELLAGTDRVAFDDEARAGFLLDLQSVFPALRTSKAGAVMRALRIRKDAAELARMREAAKMVDDAIPAALALCRPGRTEAEIDTALRELMIPAAFRGANASVAFTIIAGGPNAAFPHHETGARAVAAGDVVILDFGTRLHGYHSDITVTCAAGEPRDPEVRKVYRVVWEAQQKALEAVRPGVSCEAIDHAAREHIAAAGYGEHFLHRTGHGLGLQVHEPPYLVVGNPELLEEGMCFSIEPGIYLPGRFGVRLEVITSVGVRGAELINRPSAQELPVC